MTADPAAEMAAGTPPERSSSAEQCVLLTCFAGAGRAGKARRPLNERLVQDGDAILDQVVLKVSAKHGAAVHDPKRTLAGILTPVLTWGLFGLAAGGLKSLAVWAVVGAICGGLYAYYFEHLLSKNELKRLGSRLPGDSSALLSFVRAGDPRRILTAAESLEPASASVAAVAADLSAKVHSDAAVQGTPKGAVLNMLLVRFTGEHGARQALATSASAAKGDSKTPQVELFIESNEHGRRRVSAPKTGTAAFSKSDTISWGAFGLVYGLIVGFIAGDKGLLGSIESGLLVGLLWGLFGTFAGALYGTWAGRGLSARRLKGLGAFVPPGTSLAVAWAEGAFSKEAIERWAPGGSQRLGLSFHPVGEGAVLGIVQ